MSSLHIPMLDPYSYLALRLQTTTSHSRWDMKRTLFDPCIPCSQFDNYYFGFILAFRLYDQCFCNSIICSCYNIYLFNCNALANVNMRQYILEAQLKSRGCFIS